MTRNRQHPFGALWSELNQAQDEFARWVNRLSGAPATGPELNVWEDEHAVFAEADLPGVDPAKLEITVTGGNQLTVQGEPRCRSPRARRGCVKSGPSASSPAS